MLNASMSPMTTPAMTAAMLFPRPPRIATVKPLIARGAPMSYCVWARGEMTHPANAPMAAAIMNEYVTIHLALMPHNRAAVRLAAQARMALPTKVNLKNRLKATTMTALTPSTHNTCGEI